MLQVPEPVPALVQGQRQVALLESLECAEYFGGTGAVVARMTEKIG